MVTSLPNADPVLPQFARFNSKAAAEEKCAEIATAKAEEWEGRADQYAVPFKPDGQTKWFVPVLAGYESFFEGIPVVTFE
jgi:hypothetical protein